MQYSSASSIQAWNSTKHYICFGIFMSTDISTDKSFGLSYIQNP